jgi:hypothetical protein
LRHPPPVEADASNRAGNDGKSDVTTARRRRGAAEAVKTCEWKSIGDPTFAHPFEQSE